MELRPSWTIFMGNPGGRQPLQRTRVLVKRLQRPQVTANNTALYELFASPCEQLHDRLACTSVNLSTI